MRNNTANIGLIILALFIFILKPTISEANKGITPEMKVIHEAMQNIFPIAVKHTEPSRKDIKIITENIKLLKEHTESLKPHLKDRSEGFKISHQLLLTQLNHIHYALENNENSYALSMIRDTPQMCTTCHTQDEQALHFDSSGIKKILKTEFQRGEYHFMTRDYQEALLDFNDHLVKQNKIKSNKKNSESIEKILLIYIQVFRDTENAEMYFERLLDSGKLSINYTIDINYWLQSLRKIQYNHTATESMEELEKEVKAILEFEHNSEMPIFINEENKVSALWVRALIYDFMNKQPKHPDTAKLLFWLASLESALDYGRSYQLPEIYLKHCIVTYPKHPYAKRCFSQYKLLVEFQYTGSGGTRLPLYQKLEIESLENKL